MRFRKYGRRAIEYSLAWHLTDWPSEMEPSEILSLLRSGDYDEDILVWEMFEHGFGGDVAESIEAMAEGLTEWFDLEVEESDE